VPWRLESSYDIAGILDLILLQLTTYLQYFTVDITDMINENKNLIIFPNIPLNDNKYFIFKTRRISAD